MIISVNEGRKLGTIQKVLPLKEALLNMILVSVNFFCQPLG
jgi:hypothetical protein